MRADPLLCGRSVLDRVQGTTRVMDGINTPLALKCRYEKLVKEPAKENDAYGLKFKFGMLPHLACVQ